MKTRTVTVVDVSEWDKLVKETYNKPYSYQQQDGCKERGLVNIDVPEYESDYENDSIVEKINGPEEGVSFKAWLARDPETPMKDDDSRSDGWGLDLFWCRNFYPDISMIVNDLHRRGLLEEGSFSIDIDW